MKRNSIASTVVCFLTLALGTGLRASQPVTERLPDSSSLRMTIPDDWKVQRDLIGDALNLRLAPAGKGDFMILITVLPVNASSPVSSAADVRRATENIGKKQLAGALQKEVVLTEIKTAGGIGYLYHMTDLNPEKGAGDYREGNQGMVLLGTHLMAVTILTHTGDDAIVAQAIDAIKTLQVVNEPPKPSEPDRMTVRELPDAYEITVPVSRLQMTVPKENFTQGKPAAGGSTASSRYFFLEDKTNRIYLSGWFEPQEEFPGMQKFWASEMAAWAREKMPLPESTEFRKLGNWDAVIYQISRKGGSNSHIRAHWLQDGTWIDLHLSMDSEKPKNEQALESLLARIRVTAKSGT